MLEENKLYEWEGIKVCVLSYTSRRKLASYYGNKFGVRCAEGFVRRFDRRTGLIRYYNNEFGESAPLNICPTESITEKEGKIKLKNIEGCEVIHFFPGENSFIILKENYQKARKSA